jgi:hypothetical protein
MTKSCECRRALKSSPKRAVNSRTSAVAKLIPSKPTKRRSRLTLLLPLRPIAKRVRKRRRRRPPRPLPPLLPPRVQTKAMCRLLRPHRLQMRCGLRMVGSPPLPCFFPAATLLLLRACFCSIVDPPVTDLSQIHTVGVLASIIRSKDVSPCCLKCSFSSFPSLSNTLCCAFLHESSWRPVALCSHCKVCAASRSPVSMLCCRSVCRSKSVTAQIWTTRRSGTPRFCRLKTATL